jgi:hypothetical protein
LAGEVGAAVAALRSEGDSVDILTDGPNDFHTSP